MICNDCANFTECESIAMTNFDHAYFMWLLEFWDHAETRCEKFKYKDDSAKMDGKGGAE